MTNILFQAGLAKLKVDLLKEDPSIQVGVHTVDISDAERVRRVGRMTLNIDNYDSEEVQAAAAVEAQLGPIDCLVNGAGIVNKSPCLIKNGSIEVFYIGSTWVDQIKYDLILTGLDEDCERERGWDPECHIHHLPLNGQQKKGSCGQLVLYYGG